MQYSLAKRDLRGPSVPAKTKHAPKARPSRLVLIRRHLRRGRSLAEAAARMGEPEGAIRGLAARFGIYPRPPAAVAAAPKALVVVPRVAAKERGQKRGRPLGMRHTPETIERMRKAQMLRRRPAA